MAGALAQRMRKAGRFGAAYFCRHNDCTRNDPRHLLGTLACQLCYCNCTYNNLVGGEDGVRMMLANSKFGVQELFTKLLEEPLGKCTPCQQRKLVIIDALDETEYESREDFLNLVKERFPRLPKWLVFFITSRPEHMIQNGLKKYNPCVRICAGSSEQSFFYRQHEQDIKRFLQNQLDFSRLSYSVEDISRRCNGLFLYAFYIVELLNDPVHSGKIDQLSDLFPGDIDDFFRNNFKRLCDKVGKDIFKKLFGCVIAAPSPLPVAIIGYILEREKSSQDEQEVIDVVSQFLVFRTSDRSLTFLHNLIPAWLTNKEKAKRLFIDKKIAGEYLGKIFTKLLSTTLEEAQKSLPTVDKMLEVYVSRVAVRFLCHHGGKDSLKLVSSCLTSYHFLQQRIESGQIEIFNLLEDLRLVADCYVFKDAHKQKILQEISLAFESNFPVLLECPHLLPSCLLNSSKVVQDHVLIPEVSRPWLEWIVYDFPNTEDFPGFKYFATTFDETTAAVVKGNSILIVDASTLKTVGGPFEINQDTIKEITFLECSPDDKWLFIGRLNKWFSVERGCIEDFSQFSGNSLVYKWGLFTCDGQYIVVKRDQVFDFQQTCQNMFCVLDLLSLWALLEIDHEGVDKLTCCFTEFSKLIAIIASPVGKQVKRLLKFLGINPTWLQTNDTPIPYDPSCYCCGRLRELTESNQESSLSAVRQLISDLYPRIFYYQVWNFQTGKSLLEDAFCQGGQLNPFSYVCHLAPYAFIKLNETMRCCGINKAVSIANFATVNAVYALECELLSKEVWLQNKLVCKLGREMELEKERTQQEKWKWLLELGLKMEWKLELKQELELMREQELKRERQLKWVLEQMRDLELKRELELKLELKLMQELEMELELELMQELDLEQEVELERKQELDLEQKLEQKLELEREWKWKQEQEQELGQELKQELELELELVREWKWKQEQEQELGQEWEQGQVGLQDHILLLRNYELDPKWHKMSERTWEQMQERMWRRKLRLELIQKHAQKLELKQELKLKMKEELKQGVMRELELKWKQGVMQGQDLKQEVMWEQELKLEMIREQELKRDRELVLKQELMGELDLMQELELMQELGLMQKLDLMGEQELMPEQIQELKLGWTLELMREQTLEQLEQWWKRVDRGVQAFNNLSSRKTKQKNLFFSNFPQRLSVVGKSIAAAFTSSDTVISVRSDSIVALWSQRMDKEKSVSFKFISESSLPGSLSELSHIENWAFSPNGKRAACRQGNKIQLYITAHSIETPCTLLEGDFLNTDLVCLTFSADNILLLICIQDGKNEPRFYEWDVKRKVMSSFKSPLLTVDCFCLSSDKTKFILCGEYEVEIWKYNKGPICLLARGGVAQKFSVRFSYCTVSLDNELLVCCITNVIIVFRLCASDLFSSRQILRGHIGRIEFCKFLRVNRYLISCGVDGMVFLWDLIEAKAVGFAQIAQGQENIISMAVSPEEERLVCFTSSDRVCVIRLWNLKSALSSNSVRESMKGKADVTDTSLQLAGEISSNPKPISSVDGYKITDFSIYEDDERFTLTVEDFVSSGEESD